MMRMKLTKVKKNSEASVLSAINIEVDSKFMQCF